MSKSAVVTGFTGQSAPYLCQLLLEHGYKVYGMVRDTSRTDYDFIEEMGLQEVEIVHGDLSDDSSIFTLMARLNPTEFYNLGALSSVASSFEQPELALDITGLGPVRILEAIRQTSPTTRLYQAGSVEEMGGGQEINPKSPYAAAKVLAHNMVKIYRESYKIHASVGILSNHESERRGLQFVSRKITDHIGRLANGKVKLPLTLGNLNACRDWSHAKDMVRGQYLMLQQNTPDDYIFGSGKARSVRDFCEQAFAMAGFKVEWHGEGILEEGIDAKTGNVLVGVNKRFYRPTDITSVSLVDSSKARKALGWEPLISFENLVYNMVTYDIKRHETYTHNQ